VRRTQIPKYITSFFLCVVIKKIRSESYKLPHIFSTNEIRCCDGKDVKFDSKKIGKRVLLAQSCHEQPMLQTYMGLPDGKL
jgi:hypothetical protein